MAYTLIIAEKPNASQKIAQALSDGKPKSYESPDGVKYYEFVRGNKKYIVAPAVGHLFSLKDVSNKGWTYPVFDYVWKPTYEINKKAAFAKRYYKNLENLCKKANHFIVACDFDLEGSVIGYNVVKHLCNAKDGGRMKFSTLTKIDLEESFEHVMKHLDYPQIESGLTRHELDFLYGINMSRALTTAIKKGGKKLSFYLLTAGRVQTPMLYFLMNKEKEIRAFKPDPFWLINAIIPLSSKLVLECGHEKDKIWKKPDAEKIFKKTNKAKVAKLSKIERKEYSQRPPFPFDLTTLQTESYRFFGWSPRQTNNVAQSLYEKGYISYPRTSSQKLPEQIGIPNILNNLAKINTYSKLASKVIANNEFKPNEGKKSDAAHPAIYPTAEIPDVKKLNSRDKKLYDLIVRRFLAVFGEPAKRESMKMIFDLNGEKFTSTGRRTVIKGWTEFYGRFAKSDEMKFPDVKVGDKFNVKSVEMIDKETSPPPRYSQGSIIKELEKHNLGTKTTRASILQTLYDRGYIQGKSIEVTQLGMKVAQTLGKYIPELVSEELTRSFEKDMEDVEAGKKKRDNIIKSARRVLKKISKEIRAHEAKIGAELEKGILETKEEQSYLGACTSCEGGDLKVMFNPMTKKRFVGCSNYFVCSGCSFTKTACKCKCPICGQPKGKCKCDWKEKKWTPTCTTGYPLPLKGMINNTGAVCEKCGTPIIQVWRKGKRPFRMCLDPLCETKKDWNKPDKGVTDVKKVHKKNVKVKKIKKRKMKIVKKKSKRKIVKKKK